MSSSCSVESRREKQKEPVAHSTGEGATGADSTGEGATEDSVQRHVEGDKFQAASTPKKPPVTQ
jgi:hypothetical protein